MKTINLKKYYYPICKKDTLVEVPDEVADAIAEESRAEDANDAKQHYHCYSLDASPGMENHFPEQAVSPEDILMEKETEREQEAARALMMERLREALATDVYKRQAGYRTLYGIRVRLSEHISELPLGWFNRNAIGKVKQIAEQDVEPVSYTHLVPAWTRSR